MPDKVRLAVAGNLTEAEPAAANVPSEKIRAETVPIVTSIELVVALRVKVTPPPRSTKPGRWSGAVPVKE